MKDALNSMLSGGDKEDVGTAAPYESDFSLAGEDDMEMGDDGLLSEVQGLLASATPEQLKQVKDILGGASNPMGGIAAAPAEGGGDLGMPL